MPDPLARTAARLGLSSGQLWTVAVTTTAAVALLVTVTGQLR